MNKCETCNDDGYYYAQTVVRLTNEFIPVALCECAAGERVKKVIKLLPASHIGYKNEIGINPSKSTKLLKLYGITRTALNLIEEM